MGNEFAIELSLDIPFGILKFTLCDEEVAILKLISCQEDKAIKYWEQLWKYTEDYEDLLFSCKELMPSAVKKIQTSCAVPAACFRPVPTRRFSERRQAAVFLGIAVGAPA